MPRNVNGMTLIELLVVVAIAGITLGFGMPAFSSILERTQATNAYYLLTSSLMAARSGAVTRHRPVSVCPSADGLRCRDDAVWDEGWIVYLDPVRSGQPGDAAAVLKRIDRLGSDLVVRATVGRPQVRYQPDGRASGSNVSLRICSRRSRSLLGSVIVNNAGRARSERSSTGRTPCPYAL